MHCTLPALDTQGKDSRKQAEQSRKVQTGLCRLSAGICKNKQITFLMKNTGLFFGISGGLCVVGALPQDKEIIDN